MAHEGAAAKRPEPSKHWPVRYLTVLGWGHSGARMYRDHLLEDSPNPGRSAARQPTGGPRGSVLVVEDDALLALALEDALLDAGFSVCAVAASEEQAVSDALTHRPPSPWSTCASCRAAAGRSLRCWPANSERRS